MRLHHLQGREKKGYTTFGCIWEKGEATSLDFRLQDDKGNHIPTEEKMAKMLFVIRMYLWADSEEIRLQHTFLYDGEEDKDYLKGMGIRFDMNMSTKSYDRHIQFGTDKKHFHEAAVMLEDDSLNLLIERLGAFYYLDKEEKARITEGKIKDRPFDWPRFATAVSAFSAMRRQDKKLAQQSWKILIESLWQDSGRDGHRMRNILTI